jgi:hypothetical protein
VTTIVLHDGRRCELVTRRPDRSHRDIELVLEVEDGSAAGTAAVHLEPDHRAEVALFVRPSTSSDEAGTVLLAEAADHAARSGAVELLAPHAADDPHARAILEGIGLGFDDHGSTAVIDLRPLQAWRALTPAGV